MTGVGRRFVEAGFKELKPVINVGGRPILEHVLNMFSTAEKTVCIVSSEHEQKEILIAEILRIRPQATICEIPAHKFGPGYAISQASNYIHKELPTIVSYCDWAGIWNVENMLQQLNEYSGSILTYTGFHPHMLRSNKFAYVKKSDNLVTDIQEKSPFTTNPMQEEASSGCYGFSSGALLLESLATQIENSDELNGEFYISLTYKSMLKNSLKVGTVLMDKFFQWGTPEDLKDWEYWIKTISSFPGTCEASMQVNNVILAAGNGKRIADFAKKSKPNLIIAGQKLWEYSSPRGLAFDSSVVVSRAEVGVVRRKDVEVLNIPEVTEGQAITARIGIESIKADSILPVNVLSSDNAFTPENFFTAHSLSKQCDLVVWTSKNYPVAQLNPDQYSWINLKEKSVIYKRSPESNGNWELITGNFTFSNRHTAIQLIEELILKKIRVNNEFYLDSVIDLAFKNNLLVQTFEINNFIAVGTPEELLTYAYFEELIQK